MYIIIDMNDTVKLLILPLSLVVLRLKYTYISPGALGNYVGVPPHRDVDLFTLVGMQ